MQTSYFWLEYNSCILIIITSFNILQYIYEANLVSQHAQLYGEKYITAFTTSSFLIGN